MIDRRADCPDWLDEAARFEWRRLVARRSFREEDSEALATYCFINSLRQQLRGAVETVRITTSDTPSPGDVVDPVRLMTTLDERLTSDLCELSAALGIDRPGHETRRRTRILFLDEGDSTRPD